MPIPADSGIFFWTRRSIGTVNKSVAFVDWLEALNRDPFCLFPLQLVGEPLQLIFKEMGGTSIRLYKLSPVPTNWYTFGHTVRT